MPALTVSTASDVNLATIAGYKYEMMASGYTGTRSNTSIIG